MTRPIRGAGGGGNSSNSGHVPSEGADSLRSAAFAQILDLISEGEIEGLVNDWQSVFLDETPVQNSDGTFNFTGLSMDRRNGTQWQPYIPMQADVENELAVGLEVTSSNSIVRTVNNSNVNAVNVHLSFPALTYSDPASGDLGGTTVEYAIDVQTQNFGYLQRLRDTVTGKSTSKYERVYRIDLSGGAPYNIRVRRITPMPATVNTQNKIIFSSYTEIIDAKLRYPNSALVAIRAQASQFSSIPSRAYEIKGVRIKIPTNTSVNADGSLSYTDTWDGTFKVAWSSNPAWVFYDLITNTRYGLGSFLPESQVDKWSLYKIGKYCDELVPDGFGGVEPRFSCNLYLQAREDAFKTIANLAGIFRGMAFWSAGTVTVAQDAPTDAAYLFSPANVVNGLFTYQGASLKARHTVALVTWNDPDDFYRQKVEYVENSAAVGQYGVIETSIAAVGCTSRGQAHRMGQWLLYTEQYESETVTFSTGVEGAVCRPGQVIKVADPVRSGKRTGGRVSAASVSQVLIDSDVPMIAGSLLISCVLPNGTVEQRNVTSVNGRLLSVSPSFSAAPQSHAIWQISSAAVDVQYFRVIGVAESKPGVYDVSAIAHDPQKYAAIDFGTVLQPRQISSLSATPDAPPDIKITETLYAVGKDVRVKVTASWVQVPGASSYQIRYRRDEQNYETLPETSANDVEILNAEPGLYEFLINAISPLGKRSTTASATAKILGRGAPPLSVQNFSLIPQADMAYLSWDQSVDLDVIIGGSVRIRYSPETAVPLWKNAVDICDALPGTATRASVPLLSGTYMAKFVDADGIPSNVEAAIVTTVPSALAINNVITLVESPGFTGAKTNVEYRSDLTGLALAAVNPVDSIPDIDSVPSWDYAGGVSPTGSYYFSQTVDLGAVYSSRITAMIAANTIDVSDTIDQRGDAVDDWLDLDGVYIDDVNAALYVRTTEGDPGASPVWTVWKPFFVGEYRARALQFRLDMETQSAYHTMAIQGLSVTVDMPDRTINMPALSSGTSTYHVTFEAPFKAEPAIGITTHNSISGDYYSIANKTNSGFDITFKNAAGTTVSRTFDVIAKGYGRAV